MPLGHLVGWMKSISLANPIFGELADLGTADAESFETRIGECEDVVGERCLETKDRIAVPEAGELVAL